MQKEIFKNNENKLIFLLTLLVFILHVLYTKQMGIMYVLDDEYGYWEMQHILQDMTGLQLYLKSLIIPLVIL